jgi:ectoine hydroxylase-related dioxygenase (phytanoyl-CoA dioxygenase family)
MTRVTRQVDQPLTVEAGSVVIIHADTWHRAMSNHAPEGTRRYMLKFYFVRMGAGLVLSQSCR